MIGASRSLALDQGRSQALTDDLVPLVERTVLEGHDAGFGARPALLERHDLGVCTQGIAPCS